MTSRELYFMLALWFILQSPPYIQARPHNISATNSKLATSNQLPQTYEVSHLDGKAVLSEKQNEHCFKSSIFGSGESNGDLIRHCKPGYRRSRENETCSGSDGCCSCDEGTYMPKPNDCRHCIMKTFCHDFGLEYIDFGSSTNNSKCGAEIQTQQDDPTSLSTASVVPVLPTNHTTDILSSSNTVQSTTESEQAGISGLKLWIKQHAVAIAVIAVVMFGGLLLLVLIGLVGFACFCIFRGKKEKRNLINSCYGLNVVEHKSSDCSSETNRLTDDTAEEEALEV